MRLLHFIGNYVYMEASDRHAGEQVMLISRSMNHQRPICFSFWYHMYGLRLGRLSIKVVTRNLTKVLWEKNGNQGHKWKEAKINITGIPLDYQVMHLLYNPF